MYRSMNVLPAILAIFSGIATEAFGSNPSVNLRRTAVVTAVESNRDAVVNINTTQVIRQRFGMFNDDPFFRRFFNLPRFERDVKRTSLGSGFIVHADGYIVTNAHVVDGADEIEVILAGGEHLPASVLASDAGQDIAIIKVAPGGGKKLPVVTLGDTSDLMVGEPVIAIGNPLGYQHSVTTGIISATDRPLEVSDELKLEGLIQTDTSINPGNSGGPLINIYGQVIGINTAIRGDAQNIGFSIPIRRLTELIPELLSPLLLNKAFIPGRMRETRTITPPANVHVRLDWVPDANASGGYAQGVTSINNRQVGNIVDAYVELLRYGPGSQIVLRGKNALRLTVKEPPLSDGERLAKVVMGVEVREPTRHDRVRYDLGRLSGLIISGVVRGSAGHRAGLVPGDLIVQLGRHRVTNLDTLGALLSRTVSGMQADVYIVRQGRLGRTRLTLQASPRKRSGPPL